MDVLEVGGLEGAETLGHVGICDPSDPQRWHRFGEVVELRTARCLERANKTQDLKLSFRAESRLVVWAVSTHLEQLIGANRS